jgi:uncharacterized protein (TIGR03083 family)
MAVETTASERVRAVGRAIRQQAAVLAEEWTSYGLDRPSACSGWEVRDVAAHLTQGAERAVDVVRHGLEGTPAPDFPPEARAARVKEIHGWSGAQMAASFQRNVDAAFRLLERADEAALQHVVQVPAGPHTLQQYACQRLSEATLHGWDIQVSRDPSATLSPEIAALFADYLMGRMPRMTHLGPEHLGTYHLALEGPGGGPFTLTVQADSAAATRGAPANADVTLSMPVEAFIRLAWGRFELARAIEAGQVQVEGDRERALGLTRLFPGH